jgi:hypothetical protein
VTRDGAGNVLSLRQRDAVEGGDQTDFVRFDDDGRGNLDLEQIQLMR